MRHENLICMISLVMDTNRDANFSRVARRLIDTLSNRVRGPYCKLRTEFFPPRFMAQARSALAINRGEKRGSVTYDTDRENEVSKIFIIPLVCI